MQALSAWALGVGPRCGRSSRCALAAAHRSVLRHVQVLSAIHRLDLLSHPRLLRQLEQQRHRAPRHPLCGARSETGCCAARG